METLTLIFSNLMFWSSFPLLITGGVWETHLHLSRTNHMLVQIIILLIVVGWVLFWFSMSEHQRLKHHQVSQDIQTRLIRSSITYQANEIIAQSGPSKTMSGDTPNKMHLLEEVATTDQTIPKAKTNGAGRRKNVENH